MQILFTGASDDKAFACSQQNLVLIMYDRMDKQNNV